MACYRCGSVDHIKRDCPAASSYPQAPPPTSAPDHGGKPYPPPFYAYWQRPADEIADAETWAGKIRAANGWVAGRKDSAERDTGLRALAAEQVAESRAARFGL